MLLGLSEGFHAGGLYVLFLLGLGVALAVGIAALSHQEDRAYSAALIYVCLGAVAALGLNLLDVSPIDPVGDHALVERLTELALIVAVFSAGLTVERHVRRASIVSVATLLAPLLIFAIRPLLVLATTSPRLAPLPERIFLGFFGVRGVAALFYAVVVAGSGALSPAETEVVVWTTIACVVVSIVVHGVTANSLTKRLLARQL